MTEFHHEHDSPSIRRFSSVTISRRALRRHPFRLCRGAERYAGDRQSRRPATLDPAVTIDNNDWTVTYPAYQRLVKYKTDNGKGSTDVEGDLAENWQASDDGKTWTFTLRKRRAVCRRLAGDGRGGQTLF